MLAEVMITTESVSLAGIVGAIVWVARGFFSAGRGASNVATGVQTAADEMIKSVKALTERLGGDDVKARIELERRLTVVEKSTEENERIQAKDHINHRKRIEKLERFRNHGFRESLQVFVTTIETVIRDRHPSLDSDQLREALEKAMKRSESDDPRT